MARTWVRLLGRIVGYGILVLLILAAVAITFTVGWRPVIGARKLPLTARKFEATLERMRRGDYLVHGVLHCMGCHSKYAEKTNPPVLLSKEGAGSVLYEEGNFRLVAPNITSDPETGLGKWSDDAIARAIREGIAADGSPLFPVMPYEHFHHLSDEDMASVVVFLRLRAGGAQRTPGIENPVAICPPDPGGAATTDLAGAGTRYVHSRQAWRVSGRCGNL